MSTLWTRLSAVVVSVMILSIALTRIQPFDDRFILQVLTREGCSSPCVFGIRPGVTLATDAVQYLESHPWVQNIQVRSTDFRQHANTFWGFIYWQWKPGTPLWTRIPAYKLERYDAYLRASDGLIDEIAFSTSLPLGDVVLGMGEVGEYEIGLPTRYGKPPYPVKQYFHFPRAGLTVNSVSVCPILAPNWHQAAVITVLPSAYFSTFLRASRTQSIPIDMLRQQLRLACK